MGIQSNQTNTASMRGDSEIRFLNLQRKGCERGVTTAPSRGHVPVSVQCITHPPFFPAPTEATRAKREAESQPSETPGLMCTSASFSSSKSTMKTCVLPLAPAEQPSLAVPSLALPSLALDLLTLGTTSNPMGTTPGCL